MRTVLWFIYFWIYLTALLPTSFYIKYQLSKGRNAKMKPFIERIVQNWARRLLFVAGAQVTVTGKENIPKEAALFVSNHQGNFDTPIALSQLGDLKTMVAKKELQKIPGIHSWMTYFDCIFMDREDPRQSLQCLNRAQELLTLGQSVVIFPEGTRSRGNKMGEFKPGALRCALKAGVPIVPVALDGSYRLMEQNGIWIRPAHVQVTILPPISTKDLGKENTKTLSQEVRALIEKQLEQSPSQAEN